MATSKKIAKKKLKKETPRKATLGDTLKTRILPLVLSFAVAIFAIIYSGNDPRLKSLQLQEEWERADPTIAYFLSRACNVAYCSDALQVVGRAFRAKRRIEQGETLFEVPRSMQIWDLDALRDPFIREHLFSASHKMSGNHVGSEAFLAAYLALEINRAKADHRGFDILRLAYFDTLPRMEDLRDHPVLRNSTEMEDILGIASSHAVLQGHRNMLISEWDAFSESPEFTKLVTRKQYYRARLCVLTRAVRVGPPGQEEAIQGGFLSSELQDIDLLNDEIQAYKDLLGIDLADKSQGSLALVPIADLFNHHPNSHVGFDYGGSNKSNIFTVSSNQRFIEEGHEPMVSYGTMSDAQLFSRYGFVNGDGSGHIEISIAHYHDILRLNISSQYDYLPKSGTTPKFIAMQKEHVAHYVSFDDGYEECIPSPRSHPRQAEMKRWKLNHLMKIANDMEKWTILMPPRNPNSLPSIEIGTPITKKLPFYVRDDIADIVNFDKLQSTCRIMSLINSDLDGKALQILKDNINNSSFVIGKSNDDLEFRSMMCIGRWFGTAMLTLEKKRHIQVEASFLHNLTMNEYGSKDWTVYHIRYGELIGLQAASNLAMERVGKGWEDKRNSEIIEYRMRDHECPHEYNTYLYENKDLEYDL